MFERFTDRARRVLVLAQEEARLLNHNFIGTEHILLGLIHEGEGVAAKALESLGISLEAVREKVEETIGPAGSSTTGSPPFTPRAKKVLELSLREALQLGHNYIGTEHMLLGLIREGDCVAAQVLATLGPDLSEVRQKVIEMIAGHPSPEPAGSGELRREEPPSGPRCPACRSSLDGNVGYRALSVKPVEQPVTAGAVEVLFVYCLRCGVTLAHRPAEDLCPARSETASPTEAQRVGAVSPTGGLTAEGVTDDGVRWKLTAGASEGNYTTMLRTKDASGVIDSGGMRGPKLWGTDLLNVYTGRNPDRGPRAVVVRCHPSVEGLSVVFADGSEAEMIACGEADGLRFAVLLAAPEIRLSEVVGRNRDGEAVAHFDLPGHNDS